MRHQGIYSRPPSVRRDEAIDTVMKGLIMRMFARAMYYAVTVFVLAMPTVLFCQSNDPVLENKYGVSVSVDSKDGTYSVKYEGKLWLGTGIVSVLAQNRWYRSSEVRFPEPAAYLASGKLTLLDVKSGSGEDRP